MGFAGRAIETVRECLAYWSHACDGGNQWSYDWSWITFFRDVCGLQLPQHARFAHYENAAIYGGWRFMHQKFCLVSERPTRLRTVMRDRVHVAHAEDGPSHLWADGTALWHLGGVRVDEQVVLRPETQTLTQLRGERNEEVKRVRIARFAGPDAGELAGWERYLTESGARLIHRQTNPIDNTKEALFRADDGMTVAVLACRSTGRKYALEVPTEVATCEQAQNWMRSGSWLDRLGIKRRTIAAG